MFAGEKEAKMQMKMFATVYVWTRPTANLFPKQK